MSTKKKIKTGIITALVLVLVIVMINVMQIPEVIRCERLTAKYGHEFENPTLYDSEWVVQIEDFKVLSYTPQSAEVYYICLTEGNYKIGIITNYSMTEKNKWTIYESRQIWTESGTLDGVVMPYWWHNIPS